MSSIMSSFKRFKLLCGVLLFLFIFINNISITSAAGKLEGGEIRRILHEFVGSKPVGPIEVEDDLDLRLFCRKGDQKLLHNYFRTASLRITSTAEDLYILRGNTPVEVYYKYKHTTKFVLWVGNLLPWRARDTSFTTFNSSCIGISTSRPYRAELVIRQIDPFSFLLFIGGILLFYFSPKLSESILFFYVSGTLLGAIGAFLVILFIVYKFLPKGKTGIFSISILSSLFLYLAGEIYSKFEQICKENLGTFLVYLTIGACISFAICYRFGPPTNHRTIDMIRWSLMGFGLALIHFSSDLVEISTAVIVIIIAFYNFYEVIFYKAQKAWRKKFPPKARLLSEEEYLMQGTKETAKALEELKSFCLSPDCNSWKLVKRLRNPKRFSEFMSGQSHLSDDEMMDYEEEHIQVSDEENDQDIMEIDNDDDGLLTDDSSDELIQSNGNGRFKSINTNNHSLETDDSDTD